MLTTPEIPEYESVAVIGLVLLLSLKEVLSASKFQGQVLKSSLNIGIAPLLISFIAVVVYKTLEIL
jgi:uncharacterized membrane protein (DUF485 family)